tara:strand:- start:10761 stop:12665 length:1905 start_codon:yes stop_codon:yes gene_type:complete
VFTTDALPAQTDIDDYLKSQNNKSLLRFLTCGSVDDGKSTLIGRLLYESKMIYDDQLSALHKDSKKFGTTGEGLDFALLVDGLSAEREQGITIDVAYRYFSTDKRKFIVIDTPGHEQYTRNMATGASHADLAVVMIDARKGVLPQTKRHSYIAHLLGIKHIVLAVNKMDLVEYSEARFSEIWQDYLAFAESLNVENIHAIPLSALQGDNLVTASSNMPWYEGPSLMSYLETVQINAATQSLPFTMPIQWVNRPNLDFRGFTGRVASGNLHPGDAISILPSNRHATVERIVTYDGDLTEAQAGQSITCVLTEEIDVSRGDVFVTQDSHCHVSDEFTAEILWMSEKPFIPGRQYLLRQGTTHALCTPSKPTYRVNIHSLVHEAAEDLSLNEIGCCEILLNRAIAFAPYRTNPGLGSFILIDRATNATVAAGFIQSSESHLANVKSQPLLVDKQARSGIKPHKPAILWLTGLFCAGKSTIANLVELKMNQQGIHTMLLDGDNIRRGLNRDLGFSEANRVENIRRIAEVADLMSEAGLICLVSFISPFAAERQMARTLIGDEQFVEIYVKTPLEVAEQRDTEGLYKKARAGVIEDFTGINSPYEEPESPELIIDTTELSPEESAQVIINYLKQKGITY